AQTTRAPLLCLVRMAGHLSPRSGPSKPRVTARLDGGARLRYDRGAFYCLIQLAMSAMYPRAAELTGMDDADVEGYLRRYRRESTFLMWLGLVAGTWVFVWSPLLTVFLPLPSFLLPRTLLDRHAHRITTTRL